jgi:hypothetical protein
MDFSMQYSGVAGMLHINVVPMILGWSCCDRKDYLLYITGSYGQLEQSEQPTSAT